MENSNMKFQVIGDERGSLISLEAMKNIPFNIKRVYYIYGVDPKIPRGFHAHKDLQQVLVCVNGSCTIILDDGNVKTEHILNEPDQGVLVDKMVWHEMHNFSEDCILMVLASDIYKEEDYIRNFDDFRIYFKEKSISNKYFSHEKSLVETNNIGENTKIWAYTHVFQGAEIGENCNINDHTLIENDVVLGNNVTVKSGVHIWDGARIGNNVFIGPSVVFTNDLNPRSKRYPEKFAQTIINDYASIGANSTIVAGNVIGEYAMIGAGSVVTKDIPPYTLWYGNPAVFRGYVCECGNKLNAKYICQMCNKNMEDKIVFI